MASPRGNPEQVLAWAQSHWIAIWISPAQLGFSDHELRSDPVVVIRERLERSMKSLGFGKRSQNQFIQAAWELELEAGLGTQLSSELGARDQLGDLGLNQLSAALGAELMMR